MLALLKYCIAKATPEEFNMLNAAMCFVRTLALKQLKLLETSTQKHDYIFTITCLAVLLGHEFQTTDLGDFDGSAYLIGWKTLSNFEHSYIKILFQIAQGMSAFCLLFTAKDLSRIKPTGLCFQDGCYPYNLLCFTKLREVVELDSLAEIEKTMKAWPKQEKENDL
jgi:hypothetical protein